MYVLCWHFIQVNGLMQFEASIFLCTSLKMSGIEMRP